jgi:radical SAM superfamily enzyme YgiQ (UPF0313 family)
VINEIKSIKQKNLIFFDSSLTIDPNYTKSLFKAMTDLNKHFSCYGNVNVLSKDEEFLKLASEAGCVNWCIGFESVSQKTIDDIGKTTNKVKDYITAVRKIHDYNMTITGSFIFGFDDHTHDTFEETWNMVTKLHLDLACFNILTPFPGTRFFDRIKNEGRITSFNWSRYSCAQTVFEPKHMTEAELYAGTLALLKKYFKVLPTLKRITQSIPFGYHPFVNSLLGNALFFSRTFDPGRN